MKKSYVFYMSGKNNFFSCCDSCFKPSQKDIEIDIGDYIYI